MKSILITGIAMLAIGAALLGYNHFSYTSRENVLQIGPITATAERTHTINFPPLLGWLLVGGGACVIAFAALSNKR